MSEVSVITIGYYHYTVDESFLGELLNAVAAGKIQSVEKKYNGTVSKVVLGKPLEISVERLEVLTDREAELEELKAKIKKLEGSSG